MPEALKASMPQLMDLADGYVVQWAAIDPTTGADVTGVIVQNVSIFGTLLGGDAAGPLGPFMLVPGPGA